MSQIRVYCVRTSKNTGKPDCVHNPGLWKGGFLAPVSNAIISAADMVDLKTFIEAQVHHDDPAMRWHNFNPFEGIENKSEAAKSVTLPNGRTIMTDRSHPAYEVQFLTGGKCFHEAMQSFNGLEEMYVFFPYDIKNNLMGTVADELDTDGNVQMTGYSLNVFYTHDWIAQTAGAVIEYKTLIGFANAQEMNEDYFVIQAPYNLTKTVGVQDVAIANVTPSGAAAGVFTLSFLAGCGNTDLVSKLGSSFVNASNFTVVNDVTKAAVAFTVAANAAGNAIVFTLSTADTDYDTGVNARISMKAVSALATAGFKYFEGNDGEGILVEMN